MKNSSLVFLKIVMWIIAGMHLVVGAGLIVAPGFAQFMAEVYGADVEWTPELRYILKPLGAFMVTLGILAAAAALNPTKHRVIMYGFVVLHLARALQRLVWAQEVQAAFGISASRNVANMVFFTFLAVAVVVLDQLALGRTSHEHPVSTET